MKPNRLLAIVALLALGLSAAGPDLSANGPLPIETLAFPGLTDAARNGRIVPIKVHLPQTGGPYPVVVVSHGAGGNWDANAAQAKHLASYGYAVLCLEHVGSNTQRLTRSGRPLKNLVDMTRDPDEVLGRPQDVSFALDRAEEWNRSHEKLRGRLDLSRVGVMGHSFGAYTVLTVCGVRPALDWLTPPVAPGRGLGPSLRDLRVKCGVALSPQAPGEPYFLPESYASLAVPLLGISGTRDLQQGGVKPQERHEAFALWPAGGKKVRLADRRQPPGFFRLRGGRTTAGKAHAGRGPAGGPRRHPAFF